MVLDERVEIDRKMSVVYDRAMVGPKYNAGVGCRYKRGEPEDVRPRMRGATVQTGPLNSMFQQFMSAEDSEVLAEN